MNYFINIYPFFRILKTRRLNVTWLFDWIENINLINTLKEQVPWIKWNILEGSEKYDQTYRSISYTWIKYIWLLSSEIHLIQVKIHLIQLKIYLSQVYFCNYILGDSKKFFSVWKQAKSRVNIKKKKFLHITLILTHFRPNH